MVASDIKTIVEKLESIAASSDAEFSNIAAIAASAARNSASRAGMQSAQVGAAARYTVAASATSLLAGFLKRRRGDDTPMREIMSAAFRLAGGRNPRHIPLPQGTPPSGWKAMPDGSFARTSQSGRKYRIAHDPQKPGGDWTLNVDGLPVAAGEVPCDLSDIARKVEAFIRFSDVSPHVEQEAKAG